MDRPAPLLQRPQVWPLQQSMHCKDSRQECARGSPSVILVATLTLLDLVGGALCFLVDSHHSLGTAGLGQPVNSPRSYNIQSHGQGKHWVICSNHNIQSRPREILGHLLQLQHTVTAKGNIGSSAPTTTYRVMAKGNVGSSAPTTTFSPREILGHLLQLQHARSQPRESLGHLLQHNIHSHSQGKHWVTCSNYNSPRETLGHLLQLQHTESRPSETLGHLFQLQQSHGLGKRWVICSNYDIHSHGQGKHWVICSNYNRVTAKGNVGSSAQTTTYSHSQGKHWVI